MGEHSLKEWLFIEEFAEESRLKIRTVRDKINEGIIMASKPGKRLMIHRSEIAKLMKRSQVKVL